MPKQRPTIKQRMSVAADPGGRERGAARGAGNDGAGRVIRTGRPQRQRPVLRFILAFGLCMGIFYALTATPTFERYGWIPYLEFNARLSGAILSLLGQEVTVAGRTIASAQTCLSIERGCDAIHPSLLFVAAVLAAPVPWGRKIWGAFGGIAILALVNLARIVTLFYIDVFYPAVFEVMHIEVWQALFIALALALWVSWALWAVRRAAGLNRASG